MPGLSPFWVLAPPKKDAFFGAPKKTRRALGFGEAPPLQGFEASACHSASLDREINAPQLRVGQLSRRKNKSIHFSVRGLLCQTHPQPQPPRRQPPRHSQPLPLTRHASATKRTLQTSRYAAPPTKLAASLPFARSKLAMSKTARYYPGVHVLLVSCRFHAPRFPVHSKSPLHGSIRSLSLNYMGLAPGLTKGGTFFQCQTKPFIFSLPPFGCSCRLTARPNTYHTWVNLFAYAASMAAGQPGVSPALF
jgi:hypothetical protein